MLARLCRIAASQKELTEIQRDTASGVSVELVDGSLSNLRGCLQGGAQCSPFCADCAAWRASQLSLAGSDCSTVLNPARLPAVNGSCGKDISESGLEAP